MVTKNSTTITLTGTEQTVQFDRSYPYFWVQNLGDNDVFISVDGGIVGGADGVITVPAGGSCGTMHGYPADRLYLLGSGKVQIMGTGSAFNPFKTSWKGGVDGTLSKAGYAADAKATGDNIADINDNISFLSARVDNIATLPEGSTTGDAELIDMRLGADGNTYPNAGTAVRTQVSELKQDLDNLCNVIVEDLEGSSSNWVAFQLKNGVGYKITNYIDNYISLATYDKTQTIQVENFGNVSPNSIKIITPTNDAPWLVVYAYSAGKFSVEETGTLMNVLEERVEKTEESIKTIYNGISYDLVSGTTTSFEMDLEVGKEYVVKNYINNYISLASYKADHLTQAENFGNILPNSTTVIVPTSNAPILNVYAYGDGKVIVEERNTKISEIEELINSDSENVAYSVKDNTSAVVVVDCNGNGDFRTIAEAYESITDSSSRKEYEVVVYPGVYNEINLIPPKYTHTHGLQPNTVIVTSEGFTGTLPVFDQQESTKLSNMMIVSHTGYCIHYDVNLDGKTIENTNLHLKKVLESEEQNPSIIGGGSFRNGTLFIWDSCIFENGYVACHTNYRDYANTHLIFKNCKFINAPMDIANTGGFGNHVCELVGNVFEKGKISLYTHVTPFRNAESDANKLFANQLEWQFIGGNNKNFVPYINLYGEGLLYSTNENNKNIVLRGNAVPIIFGFVKYRNGFSRATGKAFGSLLVKDEQAGYPPTTDVYQLWKRLGDCSTNNKTISVTVDGTTQTYTFNKNYLSTMDSEDSIIASINSVITIATLSKYVESKAWSNFVLDNVNMITVSSNSGVIRGEYIDISGNVCTQNDTNVLGLVLEDGATGEIVRVWCGNPLIN